MLRAWDFFVFLIPALCLISSGFVLGVLFLFPCLFLYFYISLLIFMVKQVIIVAGFARAGKDTVGDYLAEKHGFKKIVFSFFVGEELKKRGIEPTKENKSIYAQTLFKELGKDYLVKKVFSAMKKYPKVVVVGLKPIWEYEGIKKNYPQAKMIVVSAPKKMRFARRPIDSPNDFKAFIERDKRDIKQFEINNVFKKGDYFIKNDGTIFDLQKKVEAVYQKYLKDLGE